MPILVGFARGVSRSSRPNTCRAPHITLLAVKLLAVDYVSFATVDVFSPVRTGPLRYTRLQLWWTLRELNPYFLRAKQESSR